MHPSNFRVPEVRAVRVFYNSSRQQPPAVQRSTTRGRTSSAYQPQANLRRGTNSTAMPPPPPAVIMARRNNSDNGGGGPRRNRLSSGPCGVPQEDHVNGYRRYTNSRTELNQPIDKDLMETDFDFDSNLAMARALFDNEGGSANTGVEDSVFMDEPNMGGISSQVSQSSNGCQPMREGNSFRASADSCGAALTMTSSFSRLGNEELASSHHHVYIPPHRRVPQSPSGQ